jgi:hypothetical protein
VVGLFSRLQVDIEKLKLELGIPYVRHQHVPQRRPYVQSMEPPRGNIAGRSGAPIARLGGTCTVSTACRDDGGVGGKGGTSGGGFGGGSSYHARQNVQQLATPSSFGQKTTGGGFGESANAPSTFGAVPLADAGQGSGFGNHHTPSWKMWALLYYFYEWAPVGNFSNSL